jgi:hypothetical protein
MTVYTGIAWNEVGLGVTTLRLGGTFSLTVHVGPWYLALEWWVR